MKKTVEFEYREAWQRLLSGETVRLEKGAPATHANVSREAGRHPTALKKDRFPELYREIEALGALHPSPAPERDRSLSAQLAGAREKNRYLKSEAERLMAKVSFLESQILNYQRKLISMAALHVSNNAKNQVASIDKARRGRFIHPKD